MSCLPKSIEKYTSMKRVPILSYDLAEKSEKSKNSFIVILQDYFVKNVYLRHKLIQEGIKLYLSYYHALSVHNVPGVSEKSIV